ncbi:hypothetical protein HEK616_61520 [Streptomyces nigrescens]|uniref:Uncharacterized protein n=1 Tax=Streptomyces nigrescens TaxID=1920 RepID=A0ABM8A1Y8_STRNI|nr:hypothetical protein [Streptomyces nigrescens]BDM72665.1 hypothetical protein HEK616_61520 [Streptomyces nigrescens]
MADDRYDWLDKDTAERMLRGERVSSPYGAGAQELEQLLAAAAAVGARAPEAAPLPGEEAAVAAFRRAVPHGSGARSAGRGSDAAVPTVHTTAVTERTRFARPFRRGFAVALAACAIGGVAVAAGAGVLPGPFRGGGGPEPGSSASSAETPGPVATTEPGEAQTDGTTGSTPDATHGGTSTAPSDTATPGASPGATGVPGSGTPGRHGDQGGKKGDPGRGAKKKLLLTLCQEYESGNRDRMDRETRQRLERRAGGAEKVHAFCRAYLARYQSGGGSGDNDGFGSSLTGGTAPTGGTGESGGSAGSGDEEGDQPTQSPGASTPAPTPSVTGTNPAGATPSATASGGV